MSGFEGKRCCKRVHGSGHMWGGSPCSKPVRVKHDGQFYCTVHDPARVKAKTDERHEALYQKAKERSRIMMLEAERQAFGRNCIAAIREIASGHNDAQSLAQSVLESDEDAEIIARAIMAERERCAVVCDEWNDMKHVAYDLEFNGKLFPKKSPVHEALATAIRKGTTL